MADLKTMATRRLTPENQRRLLRAIVPSAVTGGAIYMLVVHLALPALRARLTPAQVEWFHRAFAQHPAAVLGGIFAVASVLALPVLGVFRWMYGPLHTLAALRRRA